MITPFSRRLRCVFGGWVLFLLAAGLDAQTPIITAPPARWQVVDLGQSLTLGVTATGTPAPTYQWLHNGRPVAGATTASCTLAQATMQDSGWYQVVVTNSSGSATSAAGFVNVAVDVARIVAWGGDFAAQAEVPAGLSRIVAVAGGKHHSLALKDDGTVVGWGDNRDGQITVPAGLAQVVAVAAGASYHSLALRSDGTVAAWGYNGHGETDVPAGLADVVAIAVGDNHSLALKRDGSVVAWGLNGQGQTTLPAGLANVVSVTGGAGSSYALRSDGTVVGWGSAAAAPAGLNGVAAITAGPGHCLALKNDGTVAAWGRNDCGQATVPGGLTGVVAIAAGGDYSLALKRDGTVVAWGAPTSYNWGQATVPAGLSNIVSIATGVFHSLALKNDAPPTIVTPPASQAVSAGQGATLRVSATGSGVLTYQWKKGTTVLVDGGKLTGASTPSLTIGSVSSADTGDYTVTVSNGYGSATSEAAALTTTLLPVITAISAPRQVVNAGQSLVLSAVVTSGTEPAYQWRRNGLPLSGATGASHTITNAGARDAGWYQVVAANAQGATTSAAVFVLVATTPAEVVAWGSDSSGQISVPTGLNFVAAIAAGGNHSVALRGDGTVSEWGDYVDFSPMVRPAGLDEIVAVAAGPQYDLALRSDGTVKAWGWSEYGQTAVPAGLGGVVALAAGRNHALALKGDGTVAGWGSPADTAATVPAGLNGVVAIAAGDHQSLALKSDGTVTGWGQSAVPAGLANVVALATSGSRNLALKADGTIVVWGPTTPPAGLNNVAAVAAGWGHCLALKQDGSVVAWGDNTSAQATVPAGLSRATAIAAGFSHSLALVPLAPPVITTQPAAVFVNAGVNVTFTVTASSNLPLSYQWRRGAVDLVDGGNIAGATGATLTLAGVQQADAGLYTVAVSNSLGTVTSSGAALRLPSLTPEVNEVGDGLVVYHVVADRIGDWTVEESVPWLSAAPASGTQHGIVEVTVAPNTTGLDRTATLSIGGQVHTVTQRAAGRGLRELWAMGNDADGQLGDGTTNQRNTPIQVAANVQMVATGGWHCLFVKADGTLWATGRNSTGQLGDGGTTSRSTPVSVATGVRAAAARFHSLYVKTDGTLWAMGWNNYGQLGDGTLTDRSTAVQVATDVRVAAAGNYHSLFVKTDGTLWAVGQNDYGQLGDGTVTSRSLPVQVATGVETVAAGVYHSLFVKTDGTLWAMGWNSAGQLGDGTATNRPTPVPVATGVREVSAGGSHSLWLKTDGGLWAVGGNTYGQLGDGSTANRSTPVPVATDVKAAAAGYYHSLFVKTDGSLWAVGRNQNGQLGDGGTTDRSTPLQVASNVQAVSAGVYYSSFIATGDIRIVGDRPAITVQPDNRTMSAGGTATFEVIASGAPPLNYQWKKAGVSLTDGGHVSGATTATLTLSEVSVSDAGIYACIVTNTAGSQTSADLMLIVSPAYGAFVTSGSMGTARIGHTATLLPGGKVLIAGGSGSAPLASAELYDPATGTFSPTGSMGSAHAVHTATLLTDGKVLIAGGDGAASTVINSAELYDPATGTFAATGSLGTGRSAHTATLLPDGKVLIAGGTSGSYVSTASAELYDPATGTFSPTGGMGTIRAQHAATLLPNGKVLVVGGGNWTAGILDSAELYDPATGTFAATGSMGAVRYTHTATLLQDGKVLITGGGGQRASYAPQASAELYDPVPGSFTATGSMSTGRTFMTLIAVPLAGGKVLIAGGYNGVPLASAEWYDPAAGTFAAAGSLAGARYGHTTTLLPGGNVLMAGGADSSGRLASAELYEVVAPTAPIVTTPPQPQERTATAGEAVTFTVTATGTPPLAYQWSRNGVNLTDGGNVTGATTATLTLTNVQLADAGIHVCRVANGAGSVTSPSMTLAVTEIPAITTMPASRQVVSLGQSLTLNVVATGTPAPTYQWKHNGRPIAGATAASHTIAHVMMEDAGWYQVVVANSAGAATSAVSFVNVAIASAQIAGWGSNTRGQLGDNSTTNRIVPVSVLTSGALAGKAIVATAAGYEHSLALAGDGTVYAWGSNHYGELGNDSTTDSAVPVAVNVTSGTSALAGKAVVAIAAGAYYSMALASDGTVYCWGRDNYGQVGYGDIGNRLVPGAVDSTDALAGKTVVALAAGAGHCLVLASDGTVCAWGYNNFGNLGDGSTNNSAVPVAVSTTSGVSALAGKTVVAIAAGGDHSLALASDGTLCAWGDNSAGGLGNNSTIIGSAVPVAVDATGVLAGKTVVALAAGEFHSLVLASDGSVYAWGSNYHGLLGNNSLATSLVPVAVNTASGTSSLAGKTVAAIAAGRLHSLALASDGTVHTWGFNSEGELGINSTTDSLVPVAVNTASGTSAIAGKSIYALGSTYYHSLVVAGDPAVSFTDGFEAVTLNPFWTDVHQVSGEIALSTEQVHAGAQSVKFSTTASAPYLWLRHSFPRLMKGTVSIWFYDTLQAGAYAALRVYNTTVPGGQPGSYFDLNIQDWNSQYYFSAQLPAVGQTTVRRTLGWHHFELRVNGTGCESWLDGGMVSSYAGASWFDMIEVGYVLGQAGRTYYFDDFSLNAVAGESAPPVIVTQPVSQTVNGGANATFAVEATGAAPVQYQWRKGAANLVDGGGVSGATTATLALANVAVTDAGAYSVVVTNSAGSVISDPATLTVTATTGVIDSTYNGTTPGTSGNYADNINGGLNSQGVRIADRFHTGSGPWRLSSVTLYLYTHMGLTRAWSLGIYSDIAGKPGAPLAALLPPANAPAWTEGAFTFTAPADGIGLAGDTTYWLVLEPSYSEGQAMILWWWGTDATRNGFLLADRAADRASWNDWRAINQPAHAFSVSGIADVAAPSLHVTPSSLEVPAAGGTFDLTAVQSPEGPPPSAGSSVSWAHVPSGQASITVVLSQWTISVQVDPNPAAVERNGTLSIMAHGILQAVPVHQAAAIAPVDVSIATQPTSQMITTGQTATLNVVASGTAPLSYQWYVGPSGSTTSPIEGATAASYTTPALIATTSYWVRVSSSAGHADSATAVVTAASFVPTVALTGESGAEYSTAGGTATLRVRITYTGRTPTALGATIALPGGWTFVSYAGPSAAAMPLAGDAALEWAFSNIPADELTFTFTVSYSAGQSGTRTVTGAVDYRQPIVSAPFTPLPFTPITPPTIITPPASQAIGVDSSVTFTVVASGTGPLSYQWRKNGVNIADDSRIIGATTATLSIAAVTVADAGTYSVVVSNAAGGVPSASATLAVVEARAGHNVAGGGYFAGGTVTIANTITYSGTLSGLGWSVLPPAGWAYASGSGSEGDVKPVVGETSLLEWTWTTIPTSPVTFSYTLNVPAGTIGTKDLAALVLPRQSGRQFQVLVQPDPLAIDQVTHHAADTNRDLRISLTELLRVIELYNTRDGTVRTGAYVVDAGNLEDGFATDPARSNTAVVTLTKYHSGDSNHDGKLSLTELLRVIELYNTRNGTVRTGEYHVQAGTEDGFGAGP